MEKIKKIIIKCDEKSKFLRNDALIYAVEYEEKEMGKREEGFYNGISVTVVTLKGEWFMNIYHTKTAIIANVYLYRMYFR